MKNMNMIRQFLPYECHRGNEENENIKDSYYEHNKARYEFARIHEALMYYEQAINYHYDDTMAVFWYAYALREDGNLSGARNQFRKYLETGKDPAYILRSREAVKEISEKMRL